MPLRAVVERITATLIEDIPRLTWRLRGEPWRRSRAEPLSSSRPTRLRTVADTVPIVGAGRTGLALAAVLARFGVPSPIRGSWSKLVNTDVCLGEQERGTYQG